MIFTVFFCVSFFFFFAWQLPRPSEERRRVKECLWWQTKGTIIYRKWVSPHREGRGCKWHINKTRWASCMGSWHPQSPGHVFHLFRLKERRPRPKVPIVPRLHLRAYDWTHIWIRQCVCLKAGWFINFIRNDNFLFISRDASMHQNYSHWTS